MRLQEANGPVGGKAMDEASLRKVAQEIDVGGQANLNQKPETPGN